MPIGTYIEGPPTPPPIRHDNGCFENGDLPRAPTMIDRGTFVAGRVGSLGYCSWKDNLADGCAAYDHFLHGNGADRWFSYERFAADDDAGRSVVENAVFEAIAAAIQVYQRDVAPRGDRSFSFTQTDSIPVGAKVTAFPHAASYPYPRTENWQKAIGAHQVWISGDVTVEPGGGGAGIDLFTMDMVLHAEDRYNFNPGQADISTGLADSLNCRLELSGIGQQYMHRAELRRRVQWQSGDEGNAGSAPNPSIFDRDEAPRTRRSRETRVL